MSDDNTERQRDFLIHTDAEIKLASVITSILMKLREKGIFTEEDYQEVHKEAEYLGTLKKYQQTLQEDDANARNKKK